MKTMYKGIPFSPRATLTQEINGSATVIPVSDVNAFPEAPNLATIGTDDAAETILYSAKTENALSGCTRGVEGSAKTWSAGSIIARNFTAVEYGYIIDNIQQLFNEQEFTARINEEGHLIITLGTGTEIDCGNAKGDRGPTGPAGTNGTNGKDATINGVNVLTLDATGGITGNQSGNTYIIDGSGKLDNPSGGTTGQILEKTATGTQWADKPSGGISQSEADARYLQLSGGTINGYVTFKNADGGLTYFDDGNGSKYQFYVGSRGFSFAGPNNEDVNLAGVKTPTLANQATPKSYVDALKPTRLTATLNASSWSGNSQTITVNGVITNTSAQDIDISCADKASADAWAAGGVWCSNPTQTNRLTFTCTTPPTANINLNIRLWEVG